MWTTEEGVTSNNKDQGVWRMTQQVLRKIKQKFLEKFYWV